MRQLILDLVPDQPPTLENFSAGVNADALTGLAQWLGSGASDDAKTPDTCFFLWGDAGAGKSHLLAGCAATGGASLTDAATDPTLATLPDDLPFIAIDNVTALNANGQIVLFNRFNRLKAAGGRLLVAAPVPPLQLTLREDLRTRLGSGQIFRLHPLSDDEKLTALAAQAQQRGMKLNREALDYLISRAPRDMRSLTSILIALDRYSLEQKRPLTLPLLRSVLQNHENQNT